MFSRQEGRCRRAGTSVPPAPLCVASFVLACLVLVTFGGRVVAAQQNGSASTERRDPPEDEFARERKILLGASGSDNEVAVIVAKLVRSDDARGHELLQSTLAAVPERAPLTVALEVLRSLGREMGIDADAALRESERARVERRFEFYRSYVPHIVGLCARQPDLVDSGAKVSGAKVSGAAKPEASDKSDATVTALRIELKAFLARLPEDGRRKVLAETWKRSDDPTAKVGLRLAGLSEDPGLAPEVAKVLAEPLLRDEARLALADLTWRAKPFEDLADFESFWAEHRGLSSTELATRAARAARDLGRQHSAELEAERARLTTKLLENSTLLLEQLLSAPLPPWKRIGALLDDADLRPMRGAMLDAFAATLLRRGEPKDEIRPTLGELAALRDNLQQQFEKAEDADRGPLLAAWALSAKWSGGNVAKDIVDRLLGFLAARGGPVATERLFALLEHFPEERVREQVFAALAKPENSSSLAAGIACLRKLGFTERGALVERGTTFFDMLVRDPQQPVKVREAALDALGESAGAHRAALQRLEALATSDEGKSGGTDTAPLAENLRMTALQWAVLQGRVWLQRLEKDDLKVRTSEELAFLFACLDDPAPRIRQESAKALSAYPGDVSRFTKEQIQDFSRSVIGRAGLALSRETNLACARQGLELLVRHAERSGLADASLARLVAALVAWSREEARRRDLLQPLQAVYRPDLASLAKTDVASPQVMLDHARALGAARLHFEQGVVLAAPSLAAVDVAARRDDAEAVAMAVLAEQRAALVLDLFESQGSQSGGASPSDVGSLILSAQRGLVGLTKERPLATLALAETNLERAESSAAVDLMDRWWKSVGATAAEPLQQRARLLTARALIAAGKPRDAIDQLAGDARSEARLLVAEARLAAGDASAAVTEVSALLDDPALAPLTIERARNVCVEALLGVGRLDEAAQNLARWPAAPSGVEKDRRALLEQRLTAMRAAKVGSEGDGAKRTDVDKSGGAVPNRDPIPQRSAGPGKDADAPPSEASGQKL